MTSIRFLVLAGLMTMWLSRAYSQDNQLLPLRAKTADTPCTSQLQINNPALLNELEKLFTYIGDYELPIIALNRKNDSLFCYVSAFIGTYQIQKNPPTAIVKILNREVLLYTGNEAVAQLSDNCKKYLIRKYLNVLRFDKINKERGLPAGSSIGGNYDPVLVKISVEGTKVIFMKDFDRFPFFTD